jgi:hypothetical protein
MEAMRKSWTDERLDDFRTDVDRRFDEVNERMDRGFDKCEVEFHRINDRLDGMHRTLIHGFVAMTAAIMAGYAGTIGLVIAQL